MRKKLRKSSDAAKLEMTPMIDVVFQLLIFFIVTIKQEDLLSKLNVSRPAPDKDAKKEEQPELVNITVAQLNNQTVYLWKGQPISLKSLRRILTRLSAYNRNTTIIIRCASDSLHGGLVRLLDICADAGLEQISVFSM